MTARVALTSLALLAAGCGAGSSSNPPATSTQETGAVAFSRCMRSHGVSSFPDPASNGQIPKVALLQLGVSGARFQAAQNACAHLFPNGPGSQPTQAALQQSWNDFRSFARCMRSHGVTNWPDPTRYPPHPERPFFDLQSVGIDANSPQLSTEIHACLPLLHGNNPERLGAGGP